jgi:hypothetical protein
MDPEGWTAFGVHRPKPDNPKAAIGYYTLSTLSIELNQLPEKLARKLPKHPVPAALICTLAVTDQIAIYAMVVDVINENAKGFYEQFGFTRLSDDSPRLFLPLKSIC